VSTKDYADGDADGDADDFADLDMEIHCDVTREKVDEGGCKYFWRENIVFFFLF